MKISYVWRRRFRVYEIFSKEEKKLLLHLNTMQDKRWTFYVMQMIAYTISFNDRIIIYSIIQNLSVIHWSEYISAVYCNNIGCAHRSYKSSSLNKWWVDSQWAALSLSTYSTTIFNSTFTQRGEYNLRIFFLSFFAFK